MAKRVDVRLLPWFLVFLLDQQRQIALEQLLVAVVTPEFLLHKYTQLPIIYVYNSDRSTSATRVNEARLDATRERLIERHDNTF